MKPNNICCSFSTDNDPSVQQLNDARIIYSVSPALGHNKVFFLTCYIGRLCSSQSFLAQSSSFFCPRNHIRNAAQEFLPLLQLLRRMSSLPRHVTIPSLSPFLVTIIHLSLRQISRRWRPAYLSELLQFLWKVILAWEFCRIWSFTRLDLDYDILCIIRSYPRLWRSLSLLLTKWHRFYQWILICDFFFVWLLPLCISVPWLTDSWTCTFQDCDYTRHCKCSRKGLCLWPREGLFPFSMLYY